MTLPDTKYAFSDGLGIAYQVVGDLETDVVMIHGFGSHLEQAWSHPKLAHFQNRLASFSRLTILDKRGTGLSDRVSPSDLPLIENRMDDLKAVLDDVGIERASLIATSDGGPLAMLFAAAYPDRTEKLILVNTYPRRVSSPDFPDAVTPEFYDGFIQSVRENWGEPLVAELLSPESGDNPEFRNWWASTLRASMSPAAAMAMVKMNRSIDITQALPAIHVPTLVIHRVGDQAVPVEGGRYIADHIPGAKLIELPGADHFPWMGDAEAVLDAIEEFVTGTEAASVSNHVLANVMFTDIVDSTTKASELGDVKWSALLQTHDGIVGSEVARFGGNAIKNTGDGWLTTFNGPTKAATCWLSIARQIREVGLETRGGLHMSEIELVPGDVRGVGVHIAARLLGLANPSELLASSVVRDLSVGSSIDFVDRGSHQLKGVPGDWQLHGVMST